MNSCVLMAEISQAPELRYTQDGQMAIAEMTVQIAPLRAGDPTASLKVVAWGNLGQQVQEQFTVGDHVLLEGRLSMNTIDRPEGYKEKVAEMTVSRVHPIGSAGMSLSGGGSAGFQAAPPPAPTAATLPTTPPPMPAPMAAPVAAPTSAPPTAAPPAVEPNFDDIPFVRPVQSLNSAALDDLDPFEIEGFQTGLGFRK